MANQPASALDRLACGNKSELAVGYSTIYGDAVGGYAPIKDVPKTWVWKLASWRNEQALQRGEIPPIPENSITKEPSAELRPGQKDTDSLPPYELLDDVLDDYVEGDAGHEEIVAMGFDPELADRVIRMVDRAEYRDSILQAPRSASRPSAAIAGCRSPTAGGRVAEVTALTFLRLGRSDPLIW
jgi:NAD+ synthetase